MTKREEELQKLMRVYGCSREEAESIYEYDHFYCDSDEHAMQYLKEHFGMSDKEVSDYFYKSSSSALAGTASVAPKRTKEQTNQLRAAQTSRVEYIACHLTTYYSFLFGSQALICGGSKVSFKCPDGTNVEVTVSKHKEQKVVTADPKRPRKGSADAPLTDRELRVMALESCLREEEKLFPHLSVRGAAFGFVIGDPKYPFGSVRLVHKFSKKVAGNA